MEIIKDIEQGSEAWLKLRMGVATASRFGEIISPAKQDLSKSHKPYALELATELMLSEPEPSFKSAAMQRGNDLEVEARSYYQKKTLTLVEEVTFIKSDCGEYGCSPDGLIGDDGMTEFKCPSATTHAEYLISAILPIKYKPQVQGQLMVSGRKWCDFVSYHPNFVEGKKLLIVRVDRDEEFISKLREYLSITIKLKNEILEKLK
jgi:hypothetical protein